VSDYSKPKYKVEYNKVHHQDRKPFAAILGRATYLRTQYERSYNDEGKEDPCTSTTSSITRKHLSSTRVQNGKKGYG
jgi:hypothetical protein